MVIVVAIVGLLREKGTLYMFTFGELIVILVVVGIVAGIVSTAAGLASLVSYPVLLALGLPPVTANVTNTVGLVFTSFGAVPASRRELRGAWSGIEDAHPADFSWEYCWSNSVIYYPGSDLCEGRPIFYFDCGNFSADSSSYSY